ncbi:hypothetical protein [Anabaena sp. PCC 7108]|uniref:hypothetical protein n=1 Tax=Anabaena sp. PCC 7108 TaxID=163908 RepID=UPI00035CF11A|nr:hypothetical protein [Anabaena sp. PCC 7108]
MVVARKSPISTKSNWFKKDSILPWGRRRSRRLGLMTPRSSTVANESTPIRSRRQSSSARNLLVSPTHEPKRPNLMKESGKQPTSNLKQQSSDRLPMMSNAGAAPLWLLRLYSFHRYSSAAVFLCVSATLVVYGWTVYSQELWSQAYRTLQSLQRYERQLTTTNATLTSKMAEEAEQPTAGLVSPNPGGTIFLLPSSNTPNSQPPAATTINSETQRQIPSPLGY